MEFLSESFKILLKNGENFFAWLTVLNDHLPDVLLWSLPKKMLRKIYIKVNS